MLHAFIFVGICCDLCFVSISQVSNFVRAHGPRVRCVACVFVRNCTELIRNCTGDQLMRCSVPFVILFPAVASVDSFVKTELDMVEFDLIEFQICFGISLVQCMFEQVRSCSFRFHYCCFVYCPNVAWSFVFQLFVLFS